ncbi:MAG: flagellar basal body protein [Alphaproteobacteria bacterium]|nr:flagellar basal body protein [Alphaproteobacteria bacterium]
MALIADDAADRAGQLLALTERLIAILREETALIEARKPLPNGDAAEEKARLVNAYRLEMARIKAEPALITGAAPTMHAALRRATEALNEALAAHTLALEAVKILSEGLVQAIAEEVARHTTGAGAYGADGAFAGASGPTPVALNKTA